MQLYFAFLSNCNILLLRYSIIRVTSRPSDIVLYVNALD